MMDSQKTEEGNFMYPGISSRFNGSGDEEGLGMATYSLNGDEFFAVDYPITFLMHTKINRAFEFLYKQGLDDGRLMAKSLLEYFIEEKL
jgi:hypothetical protein